MRELRRCQDEVASLSAGPQYQAGYRADELHYWLHVPRWLFADARSRGLGRVLDVGAAYGTLSVLAKRLGATSVCCTDMARSYISERLLAANGLQFAVHNVELEPLPFPGPFDTILFTEVLEHLNFHPVPTLRKLRDALSPEGRLYLTTPDAAEWGKVTRYYPSLEAIPAPGAAPGTIDDHVWQYSREELFDVVRAAGLSVERFELAAGLPNRHFNVVLMRR
jgi:SAM-dependent methyltransferase